MNRYTEHIQQTKFDWYNHARACSNVEVKILGNEAEAAAAAAAAPTF